MPTKLIAVRRNMVPGDHMSLRDGITPTNRVLSDLQPKWRRFGEAGLTLLERGEFQRAAEKPKSKLSNVNSDTLATTINEQIIPKMPTEAQTLSVDVVGVEFMGKGRFPGIAYLLDPTDIEPERRRVVQLIEKMSGLNLFWRDLIPHVTVATINRSNAEQRVLDAFQDVVPSKFRFDPVVATSS